MNRTQLVIAVVFFATAALVFVLADGARRIYSGGFFALLGVVMLVNARRVQKA